MKGISPIYQGNQAYLQGTVASAVGHRDHSQLRLHHTRRVREHLKIRLRLLLLFRFLLFLLFIFACSGFTLLFRRRIFVFIVLLFHRRFHLCLFRILLFLVDLHLGVVVLAFLGVLPLLLGRDAQDSLLHLYNTIQALTLRLLVQWPGGPVDLKTYWPPKKLTGPGGQ